MKLLRFNRGSKSSGVLYVRYHGAKWDGISSVRGWGKGVLAPVYTCCVEVEDRYDTLNVFFF